MISSGTLVFTAPIDKKRVIEDVLDSLRINYAEIGRVRKGKASVVIHRKKGTEVLSEPRPERDELARLWEIYPRVVS